MSVLKMRWSEFVATTMFVAGVLLIAAAAIERLRYVLFVISYGVIGFS